MKLEKVRMKMKTIENNEFYCSISGAIAAAAYVDMSRDVIIGFRRSFSNVDFWNAAVPSVTSVLNNGVFFSVKNGVANYTYVESEFSCSFFVTVSNVPVVAAVKPVLAPAFICHSMPVYRHVSCGHLVPKCTALTL